MGELLKFAGGIAGIAAIGMAGYVGFKVITAPLSVVNTATNSATGVVSRTLDPNNVITKYEWFHDAHGVFKTRLAQIQTQKRFIQGENDSNEKIKLNNELRGMQTICFNLANQYNANATKTNQSIFMGREAPSSLDPNQCN